MLNIDSDLEKNVKPLTPLMFLMTLRTVICPTFTNYGDFRAKIVGPLETVYVGTSKME